MNARFTKYVARSIRNHAPAILVGVPFFIVITSDAIGAQLARGTVAVIGSWINVVSDEQMMAIMRWHLWNVWF